MIKFQISRVLAVAVAFLFLSGCAGKQIQPPNPLNPIRTIAVLPMLNNSDDVEAPERVRNEFYQRISKLHYAVQPIETTNQILNEQMGVTLGKQLGMVTPQQIGEALGVDGVFYGYLINFDEITTGALNLYKVRMGWKLVNTKTGEMAWGRGIAVRRSVSLGGIARLASSKAEEVNPLPASADPMAEMPGLDKWIMMKSESVSMSQGLATGLGTKFMGAMTGKPLKKEMGYAFQRLFPSMLVGPGDGIVLAKE